MDFHTPTILAAIFKMKTQCCSKCGIEKIIDDFYKNNKQCKECVKSYSKKYKEINKAEILEKKKAYRNDSHNQRLFMLRRAKARAKKINLPFNLTIEDIIIPDKCPILNIPLMHQLGRANDNSPSLDKIIPSLGYVKGNVAVISSKANSMKSNFSLEQLEILIVYMRNHISIK